MSFENTTLLFFFFATHSFQLRLVHELARYSTYKLIEISFWMWTVQLCNRVGETEK